MAIKTFKCTISSEDVTKPQSYAYKEGRACRSHPEVLKVHEAAEQAKATDLKQHQHKERTDSFDSVMLYLKVRNPHEYCWCCNKEGIYKHLLAERLLISMSKCKLEGKEINVFDPNSPHYAMVREEMGDKVAIKQYSLPTMLPDWKLKQIFNGDMEKVALTKLTGIVVLCMDCAKKYEIEEDKLFMPDPHTSLVIGSFITSVVDDIAVREIATTQPNTKEL